MAGRMRDFAPDDFPSLRGSASYHETQQNHLYTIHIMRQERNQSLTATGTNGVNGGGGDTSTGSHLPELNGLETQQTLPLGLLKPTGAQRGAARSLPKQKSRRYRS